MSVDHSLTRSYTRNPARRPPDADRPMLLDHDYFEAAAFADELPASLALTLGYEPNA